MLSLRCHGKRKLSLHMPPRRQMLTSTWIHESCTHEVQVPEGEGGGTLGQGPKGGDP